MKNIIKKNFERASTTYHQYDQVQKKSSFHLVRKIVNACPNLNPDTILDVGCGTGNLIKELYDIFPGCAYHINDISTSMLKETAKQFEDRIDFEIIHGDIEQLKLRKNYDVIASNMCLQWVDDLSLVIDKLLRHTKVFAFSCLLKDTFKDWYVLLEEYDVKHASRLYPSQKEINNFVTNLSKNILHSSYNSYTVSFSSAKESAKYLKNMGANAPKSSHNDYHKACRFLKVHDKTCHLKYNIGFFIIEGSL